MKTLTIYRIIARILTETGTATKIIKIAATSTQQAKDNAQKHFAIFEYVSILPFQTASSAMIERTDYLNSLAALD